MAPESSYVYTDALAEKFLGNMPKDPQEAHQALTKMIVGAMINEFEHAKKTHVPQVRNLLFHRKKGKAVTPMKN